VNLENSPKDPQQQEEESQEKEKESTLQLCSSKATMHHIRAVGEKKSIDEL